MNTVMEVIGFVNEHFDRSYTEKQLELAHFLMKMAKVNFNTTTEEDSKYFCIGMLAEGVRKANLLDTALPKLSTDVMEALYEIKAIYDDKVNVTDTTIKSGNDFIVALFYAENKLFIRDAQISSSKNKIKTKLINRAINNIAKSVKYFVLKGYTNFQEVKI